MTDYKLAVFEYGQGEPVVMLHGMISTHRYWNQVVERLDDEKFKIISPDLLGFGESPKPKDVKYEIEEQLKIISSNLDQYLGKKNLLVGHSMGAGIALEWAVREPQLFKGLVLTSLPLLWPESQYRQLATIVEADIFKTEKLAKLGVHTLNWVNAVPLKMLKKQNRWPEHIVEDWKKHSREIYRKIMKNAILAEEVLDCLARITIPTKIIIGQKDGMIDELGHKKLLEIADLNNNITIETVDTGHNVPLEHPGVVASAILNI